MTKILALLLIGLVCVIVNVRGQTNNRKPMVGDRYDEIIVSSDLNVRRKSKENRQGKKLTNVPTSSLSLSTSTSGKQNQQGPRLLSTDGSTISFQNRERRQISQNIRLLDLDVAGNLLNLRK